MTRAKQTADRQTTRLDDRRRDELIERYIELNPDKGGHAEARVVGYLVPVWALIGYLPAVNGDIAQLAREYEIPPEAVEAALAYYERHREVIDDRIEANVYRSS